MIDESLKIIANKPPIVATHVGGFDGSYADTLRRYEQEAATYVGAEDIQRYQRKLLDNILSPKTTLGCLVAPFGYGKTSTAIGIWHAAKEANLLAIPPFSCNSVAEMSQAIATGVELGLRSTHPEPAARVQAAYQAYLVSSAERLAEQDAAEYDITREVALRSIQDKLARGLLTLEASGIHLLKFLEHLVDIVTEAGFAGLLIIVDEFQQFLGNINKAIITNFRTLIWGLKTRRNLPLGFLLTMDPDTESNLSDRAGDILHRIKEDGLYLNFASIYDREFPRLLWDRYATAFQFQAHNGQIVDKASLEAIGQICERPDLSNGPRTVINAFQQIVATYTAGGKNYTVLDLLDDFMTGAIKFDGDRNKIASLVTELTGYDYIKRSPERINTLKLIAAFPRGCPREVAEQYGVANTFDQLADELRGEILTELPEGIALIDLQRVGKPQNKLNIILKKYWLQITDAEIISDRILTLFGNYVIEPLFPTLTNALSGWRREADNFQLTPAGGYWQIYEGTFSRDYPLRRVCVQICRDPDHVVDPFGLTPNPELDLNLVFILHSSGEQAKTSSHHRDQRTLRLHVPVHQPFELPLTRGIRWIEDYLRPVVLSPGVLLSLLDYIDRQLPTIEGLTAAEHQRINHTQAKLQNFLHTMLIDEALFSGLETSVLARGAAALPEALFTLFRDYYPTYQTLISLAQWEKLLDTYSKVLEPLSLPQRRGIEPLAGTKANIAKTFGMGNHAGFKSQVKQFDQFLTIDDWTGQNGQITFQQHPAEIHLLNNIALNGEMSGDDLRAEGRRAGYTFAETDYLLTFLEQRGYLEFDHARQVYQPVAGLSYAELDDLNQAVQRELDLLATVLANDAELEEIQASLAEIHNRLQQADPQFDELQVRLLHQQRRLRKGRNRLASQVRIHLTDIHDQLHHLSQKLGQTLPLLPTDAVLATHLNGVQRTISAEHPPAIKRLSTSAKHLAEFLKRSFELEEVTLEKLEAFVTNYQKLYQDALQHQSEAQTLLERAQLYQRWVALLQEVHRDRQYMGVAAQIADVSSLQHSLDTLIGQIREDFSTIGVKELPEMYQRYAPPLEQIARELNTAVALAKSTASELIAEQDEIVFDQGAAPANESIQLLDLLNQHPSLSFTELVSKTGQSPEQLIIELITLEKSQIITIQITHRNDQS